MSAWTIATDGVLLDHVAEFTYEKPDTIRTLFSADSEGYYDATAKLVQTFTSGGTLLVGKRKAAVEVTDRLKDRLLEDGYVKVSELFNEDQRSQRVSGANQWLDQNWGSICDQLSDTHSQLSVALAGHMQREFYRCWVERFNDSQFTMAWYSLPEDAKRLPAPVLRRLTDSIRVLAVAHSIEQPPSVFSNWVEESVTTHYRIFAEYLLYLNAEYMPALTRSSLKMTSAGDNLVLPFVAFDAVRCVKRRGDFIKHVTGWINGRGRKVVERVAEFQSEFRTAGPSEKQRMIRDARRILDSEASRGFIVSLNLLKVASDAVHGKVDVKEALKSVKLTTSKNYRWLWRLRQPNVRAEWRKLIKDLALR